MARFVEDYSNNKICEPSQLPALAHALREDGNTIATINGSFDLLHAGHLQIIYEASQQADRLIVALNSDTSIQRYKSPERPIIPLPFRLQMMSALAFVDHVTWFDETNPCAILALIKPNIHVNGPEYGEECIEADVVLSHGGAIHIAQHIAGCSTSDIINKIRRVPCV